MSMLETIYYVLGIIFTLLSSIKIFLDIKNNRGDAKRPWICNICVPIWIILVIHLLVRTWPYGCLMQSILDILLIIAVTIDVVSKIYYKKHNQSV